MWSCTSVNYLIINMFLKYIPGNRFITYSIVGLAEVLAHLSVGFLFLKLGPKATFMLGYFIAAVGGACLIFQNHFATNYNLITVFTMLAKFGASMTLCVC